MALIPFPFQPVRALMIARRLGPRIDLCHDGPEALSRRGNGADAKSAACGGGGEERPESGGGAGLGPGFGRAIGAAPGRRDLAMLVSGALWLLAFLAFIAVYWPILTGPRQNAAA